MLKHLPRNKFDWKPASCTFRVSWSPRLGIGDDDDDNYNIKDPDIPVLWTDRLILAILFWRYWAVVISISFIKQLAPKQTSPQGNSFPSRSRLRQPCCIKEGVGRLVKGSKEGNRQGNMTTPASSGKQPFSGSTFPPSQAGAPQGGPPAGYGNERPTQSAQGQYAPAAPSSPQFDKYCVIHVATTCDEHGVYVTKDSAEVIEIGWVVVDARDPNLGEVRRSTISTRKLLEGSGQWEESCLLTTFLSTAAPSIHPRQAHQHPNHAPLYIPDYAYLGARPHSR